jgi:hypothetical protein
MQEERKALDELGSLLVRKVRDQSIIHWDLILNGSMKGETALRARKKLTDLRPDQREAVAEIVSQVVDTTLHYLLVMIEETDVLTVAVEVEPGRILGLREISDSLPGELYSPQGWIHRFSKQRYEEP